MLTFFLFLKKLISNIFNKIHTRPSQLYAFFKNYNKLYDYYFLKFYSLTTLNKSKQSLFVSVLSEMH